eukprot:552153_1
MKRFFEFTHLLWYMSLFVIIFILLNFTIGEINSDDPVLVTIFAITNNQSSLGTGDVQNTGGHWLAIQQINNNVSFLPGYIFELKVLDAQKDPQEALEKALTVTKYKSNSTHIYFPLIIGPTWSSLCTSIAPILGIKHMGSISSGATSVVLSNTNKYPYFYRTIPTDALQVNGTIELCKRFGWTKIAVVYVNDAYGSYFSLGMQEMSINTSIDITSIAISNKETQTYQHAAKQISQLKIYVIVIVSHSDAQLFDIFKAEGILGYPYYFLGTDAWFDTPTINKFKKIIIDDLQGFIGPVPWTPSGGFSPDQYPHHMQKIVNKSLHKLNDILTLWAKEEKNGNYHHLHTNSTNVLSTMIYSYDAMYVIAHVIEEIENNYNVSLTQNDDELMNIINKIITEKLNLIGASGNLTFDKNGDRKNAFYSIGFTLKNGTVVYCGYFYQDIDGNIKLEMDVNKIKWPTSWNGVIPRLDVVLLDQIITICNQVSYIIFGCLCISFFIAFTFMILLYIYHTNMIIKHASWKLNVIMCIGAMIIYFAIALYGIDESYIFDEENIGKMNQLTILCNLRLWMITISSTLLMMPLFLKTYRLSHIFKQVLHKKVFDDNKLFIYTGICVIIDIILLILYTSLAGLQRDYIVSDAWKWIGSCSFVTHSNLNWLFYGIIVFWKLCELTFGIYVGLDVSRIQDGTNMLRRYDETGMQLLSILCIFFIICISIAIFVFGANDIKPSNKPDFNCLVISITVLLIGNIVLFFNLFPRIFAVITKNDNNFTKSPEKRMEDKIRKQLERYLKSSSGNIDGQTPTLQLPMGITLQLSQSYNSKDKYDTQCMDQDEVIQRH